MASMKQCETALERLVERVDGVDHDARRSNVPDRTIELAILDLDGFFHGHWRDGELCDITRGPCPGKPNIRVLATSDDLIDMVDGRLSFAHAWATGRVRLDASLRDLLRLRRML